MPSFDPQHTAATPTVPVRLARGGHGREAGISIDGWALCVLVPAAGLLALFSRRRKQALGARAVKRRPAFYFWSNNADFFVSLTIVGLLYGGLLLYVWLLGDRGSLTSPSGSSSIWKPLAPSWAERGAHRRPWCTWPLSTSWDASACLSSGPMAPTQVRGAPIVPCFSCWRCSLRSRCSGPSSVSRATPSGCASRPSARLCRPVQRDSRRALRAGGGAALRRGEVRSSARVPGRPRGAAGRLDGFAQLERSYQEGRTRAGLSLAGSTTRSARTLPGARPLQAWSRIGVPQPEQGWTGTPGRVADPPDVSYRQVERARAQLAQQRQAARSKAPHLPQYRARQEAEPPGATIADREPAHGAVRRLGQAYPILGPLVDQFVVATADTQLSLRLERAVAEAAPAIARARTGRRVPGAGEPPR